MPREVLPIKNFEGGLANKGNSKDIKEIESPDMINAMVDELGVIRLMGGQTSHALAATDVDLIGSINPGYGLFAFPSDFKINGDDNSHGGRKLLAIQGQDRIGIYDGFAMYTNEIPIANELDVEPNISGGQLGGTKLGIKPKFYFDTFSGLRVCDSEFNNNNHYAKVYKPIGKVWFYNATNKTDGYPIHSAYDIANNDIKPKWFALNSYIFPPSVGTAHSDETRQAYSVDDLATTLSTHTDFNTSIGNIGLKVAANSADTGDFSADGGLRFGISFQYDDGQESTVTEFFSDMAAVSTEDYSISVDMYASFGDAAFNDNDLSSNPFDPRLKGVNLYLTGNAGGKFDDPEYLAFWDWGDSDTNTSSITSHDNVKVSGATLLNNCYVTNTLEIKTLSALTYRLKNQVFEAYPETTAARYKTAVVSDQLVYIGSVQRYKFLPNVISADSFTNCIKQCSINPLRPNTDRILISQPGMMDIFTPDNFLDVTSNDGESITALKMFKDRLLLFKQNTLYLLNVSGEFTFVESKHEYFSTDKEYKITETDRGIVWINDNGAYIYTGEGPPASLTEGKLKEISDESIDGTFTGWNQFITANSLIGYIPNLKQVVIFKDAIESSDVMIFDLQTLSWNFGTEKINPGPKSNIVSNYDDSCMFLANNNTVDDTMISNNGAVESGSDARWTIKNIGGTVTTSGAEVKIKITTSGVDTYIVGTSSEGIQHGLGDQPAFIERIATMINENESGNAEVVYAEISGDDLIIRREYEDILSSDDPYNGGTLALEGTTISHINIQQGVSSIGTVNAGYELTMTQEDHIQPLRNTNATYYYSFLSPDLVNYPALNLMAWHASHWTDSVGLSLLPGVTGQHFLPDKNMSTDMNQANFLSDADYRAYIQVTNSTNFSAGDDFTTFYMNDAMDVTTEIDPATGGLYIGSGYGISVNSAGEMGGFSFMSRTWPLHAGMADGDSNSTNPQSGDLLDAEWTKINNKFTFPGVVFNKVDNNTLYISIWNRNSSDFNLDKRYVISNTPDNKNNVAAPGIKFSWKEEFSVTDEVAGNKKVLLLKATSTDNSELGTSYHTGNRFGVDSILLHQPPPPPGQLTQESEGKWPEQTFTATKSGKLTGIRVSMTHSIHDGVSSPVNQHSVDSQTNLNVKIRATNSSGTLLGEGNSGRLQRFANDPDNVILSIDTPFDITSGTVYHMDFSGSNREVHDDNTDYLARFAVHDSYHVSNYYDYNDGELIGQYNTNFGSEYTHDAGSHIVFDVILNDIVVSMYSMSSAGSTVSFVTQDDVISLDNDHKTGIIGTGHSTLIHPVRTDPSETVDFTAQITDHDGQLIDYNKMILATDSPNTAANAIKTGLEDIRLNTLTDVGKWKSTGLLSITSGTTSGNFKIFHIDNLGTRFRIDKDLSGIYGVKVGDSFSLTHASLSATAQYKLASLSAFGYKFDGTVDDGYMYGDIINVDYSPHGLKGTFQNNSDANITADTAYASGVTMNFNVVELTNQFQRDVGTGNYPINVSCFSTDSININEFINTSGHETTSCNKFRYTTKSFDMGDTGSKKKLIGISLHLSNSIGNDTIVASAIVDGQKQGVFKTKGNNPTEFLSGTNIVHNLVHENNAIGFRTIGISLDISSDTNGKHLFGTIIDGITIYYRNLNR